MKNLSIILLVVMVSMASCAINEEKEMAEISGSPSFQPKPLDDEWSKWLVGEWKGTIGLGEMNSEAWRKVELGLNGQFLITKHQHKVTNEEIQELKKIMHISDQDAKKYQSLPFKYLEIWTIDPTSGEIITYLFDSLRCIARGRGKREGNKEIMEWEWECQGQGGASSIRITERVSDDKLIITEKYTLPDGSVMEDRGQMTRKKITTEK
ncbi:MAG TPA: hypothetical protein VMW16_03560 [Sedimentisphaerales bacterium]|nr:hypothetical protein [Sedimentisphaerales bacterium]